MIEEHIDVELYSAADKGVEAFFAGLVATAFQNFIDFRNVAEALLKRKMVENDQIRFRESREVEAALFAAEVDSLTRTDDSESAGVWSFPSTVAALH